VAAPEQVASSVMANPARYLRAWQRRALAKYLAPHLEISAVATPGAGKTAFGLRVAPNCLLIE